MCVSLKKRRHNCKNYVNVYIDVYWIEIAIVVSLMNSDSILTILLYSLAKLWFMVVMLLK